LNERTRLTKTNFLLIIVPVLLFFLSFIIVYPQIKHAIYPLKEIESSGLLSDIHLNIHIEPHIETLEKDSFSATISMILGIKENSSFQTDYTLLIRPQGVGSAISGVSVPFSNLQSEDWYYSYNSLTDKWSTYLKYSYTNEFRIPIFARARELIRFPGDYFKSSTLNIWFSGDYYPEINLSPTSSVPRGFLLRFTEPTYINATYFYEDLIDPIDRFGIGKPSNNVLSTQIIIQREAESIIMYNFYISFLLIITYEVLMLAHLFVQCIQDRLKICVGLAITNITFLWSIRQVTNTITWSELVMATILLMWLFNEVRNQILK
jgi:hypothetical protein